MTKPQPNKPPRVKLGRALEWTDADLSRLSTVTPEDIKNASALWRVRTGRLQNLLDAAALEEIHAVRQPPHA